MDIIESVRSAALCVIHALSSSRDPALSDTRHASTHAWVVGSADGVLAAADPTGELSGLTTVNWHFGISSTVRFISIIQAQGSPEDFTEYLEQYNNTICGRHPIGILLQVCLMLLQNPL